MHSTHPYQSAARPRQSVRPWLVCLGGALALLAIMGLGVNVFSIYQPEIIRLNGFTDAQGSWITTTRTLFILAGMLIVNQLCAKLGLRLVMTLGISLVGISCLCFAFANSFFLYCLAAALTGIGYSWGGMVPLSLVIGRWFHYRRSLALGLASAGSGVSTIFAPVLLTRIMKARSMTAAFLCEGGFILICAALVWLLVRDSPAQIGLEPYQKEGEPLSTPQSSTSRGAGLSRGHRILLLFAVLLIGCAGGPGFSHLTMLYTSAGYDSLFIASLMSCLGISVCLGKILCGQVYDRMGSTRGNLFTFGTLLLSLGLCCLSPVGGTLLPFLAIVGYGMGMSITAVGPAQWANDLYGEDDYEDGVCKINIIYSVGMLVFGPLPGILADWLDGYVPAYALFFLLVLAAFLIIQGLYRKNA